MIISASRRTDIPSYYAEWFFNRLKAGYALTRNPMNRRQVSRISLARADVDAFVFWTKNPKPMLPYLDRLEGYAYYFQFTLNAYDGDVERGLPSLKERVDTFRMLASVIGKGRVLWRYDPILINSRYMPEWHCEMFGRLANLLDGSTERCTISFLDFYRKIEKTMNSLGAYDPSEEVKYALAAAFAKDAAAHGMQLCTCAETLDLKTLGIAHGSCIDGELISKLSHTAFIGKKDRNQRPDCGCVASVDIGCYNTCRNGCAYCYANFSPGVIHKNVSSYRADSELLCSSPEAGDIVKERNIVYNI